MKRKFSGLTLEEAMQLVPAQKLSEWTLEISARPPSTTLLDLFRRFKSFELTGSEAAKVMLIDALLIEIVPDYPSLKVWKSAALESDTVAGIADYLVAPTRAYLKTPLLCAIEAKRDDFDAGQVQCIAEMATCQQNNRRDGYEMEVYGIVSNGQVWVFYCLTEKEEILVSSLYITADLPELLGAISTVFERCARNVPAA